MHSESTSTTYPLSLALGGGLTLTLWAPLPVAAGAFVVIAGTAYLVKRLRAPAPRRQVARPQYTVRAGNGRGVKSRLPAAAQPIMCSNDLDMLGAEWVG